MIRLFPAPQQIAYNWPAIGSVDYRFAGYAPTAIAARFLLHPLFHMKRLISAAFAAVLVAPPLVAQHDSRSTGMHSSGPTLSGQYAFATISEIVRTLKADSTTDWTKVNLEALRQHLIDMDDVMLRASVVQKSVPGGVELTITGTGRTAAAIKRMVTSHAHVLEEHTPYQPTVRPLANGVRLAVVARDASSAATVAMIRGLGFAGLMVEGDHHAAHHLMMARGMSHH